MVTAADLVTPAPAPMPANLSQATAVEQSRAVAEVLAAVQVAQLCPRDIHRAWEEMKSTCARLAIAERAFYTVPNRGGNKPSVHLARELVRIWGNIDHGVRELRRDDTAGVSEVAAHAWDQQANVRASRTFIVPHERMRTDKATGKQSREPIVNLNDIYLNNQNNGARAVRECMFNVLPDDFVDEAIKICRATIEKGDGKPLVERIVTVIERFAEIGVTQGQIEARLERKRGQWNAADLADLHVVFSSIKRGEVRAVDEFPPAARATTAELLGEPAASAKPAKQSSKAEPATDAKTGAASPGGEAPPAEDWPAVPEIPGDGK